jgi:hypothetical protein
MSELGDMGRSSHHQTDDPDEQPVTCPFCGSDDTEPYSLFGSALLMTQHYCRACRTVFERVRDDDPPDSLANHKS